MHQMQRVEQGRFKFCVQCGSEIFINACMNMDCIHYDSGKLKTTDLFCPSCGTETVYNLASRLGKERREEEKKAMEAQEDLMLERAVKVLVQAQMASTTLLQKTLKLGYARASRLLDLLEANGVVGPPEGAKPRRVLLSIAEWQEHRKSENQNV